MHTISTHYDVGLIAICSNRISIWLPWRFRNRARAVFGLRPACELDCIRHRTHQGRDSGRTLGCDSRLGHQRASFPCSGTGFRSDVGILKFHQLLLGTGYVQLGRGGTVERRRMNDLLKLALEAHGP